MSDFRRSEAALFGAAIALRLAWIAGMSRLPFFDLPTGDSLFYAQQAARIASGHLTGAEISYPSSPLYPYLIAPFFLLQGRVAFWAIYVAQAILDAGSAVLLRRSGRILFGEVAGWAAGIAWAIYGLAVFFTADLVEATASAFLANLFLLLLIRAGGTGREEFVAGASFGAAILLRPHFLPLLPIAAAGAAWIAPAGRRARAAAALVIGAGALLAFSLARNLAVSGEPVLVSPYSGLNAYLGNHRGAKGDLTFPTGRGLRNDMDLKDSARAYPESVEKRSLTGREVSAFWWKETGREILADPPAWARLMIRKAILFWSSYEAPNHLDFHFFRSGSISLSLAAVPFGLIAPLALSGIVLIAGREIRGKGALLLAVLVLFYWACCAFFFVVDRFRLPATGWICLLAGGAVGWILDAASSRRYAAAWPALLALALGAALYLPPPARHGVHERLMAASVLAGRGRIADAERLLRTAVEIAPDSALARFNLGRLLARTGRAQEAARELGEAARLNPSLAAAQAWLGDVAASRRTPDGVEEARRCYEAALAIEPYGPEAERIRRNLESLGPARPSPSPPE